MLSRTVYRLQLILRMALGGTSPVSPNLTSRDYRPDPSVRQNLTSSHDTRYTWNSTRTRPPPRTSFYQSSVKSLLSLILTPSYSGVYGCCPVLSSLLIFVRVKVQDGLQISVYVSGPHRPLKTPFVLPTSTLRVRPVTRLTDTGGLRYTVLGVGVPLL